MSSRRKKEQSYFSHRSYSSVRRRAPDPNSLILRHYALFTSLSRYTLSPPPSPPTEHWNDTNHRAKARAYKLAQLQQKYPVAGLWAQRWPLPPSKFARSDKTAQEDLDGIVEGIVRETFESDYEKFRSVEWGRKHKIRKEHRQRIIVDDEEVKESAEAAKGEVNKALKMFVSAVKRREIGVLKPKPASSQPTEQPSEGDPVGGNANTAEEDMDIDAGLDEEIYGEGGDPERPLLGWTELLDILQASSGTSRSAQWRHWHLLNAIQRTRQRCEELFPHEADSPCQ